MKPIKERKHEARETMMQEGLEHLLDVELQPPKRPIHGFDSVSVTAGKMQKHKWV